MAHGSYIQFSLGMHTTSPTTQVMLNTKMLLKLDQSYNYSVWEISTVQDATDRVERLACLLTIRIINEPWGKD